MKKTLFILISLLIGIAIALVSSELFLRINPKFGYMYNSLRFKNDKMFLNNYNLGYVRPSALLGYEIIPNCQDIHLIYHSNSYGLIGIIKGGLNNLTQHFGIPDIMDNKGGVRDDREPQVCAFRN